MKNIVNEFNKSVQAGDLNTAELYINKSREIGYPTKLVDSLAAILKVTRQKQIEKKHASEDMNNGPLVSVIIPIYDREEILRTSIESILNQTYKNIELLLISDGSPPRTLQIIREYESYPFVKVFCFPTSSGNAVRPRNKGILESNGKYIAFLDSDDFALPTRIALSVAVLEAGEFDVVYGDWQAIIDGSRPFANISNEQVVSAADFDFDLLRLWCIPCQSTVMVRKALISKSGFIKSKMRYREDHEFWLRLAYFGAAFKKIPSVLVQLRLHAGNNELNFKDEDGKWEQLTKKEFPIRGMHPKKIIFILPSVGISGGIGVVFKHAEMLLDFGHDVTIINLGPLGDGSWFPDRKVPIIHFNETQPYHLEKIDLLFATEWSTVASLDKICAKRKLYFVQSDERRFHEAPDIINRVHDTYKRDVEFVTEAHWIRQMLSTEFNKKSFYVPNGLDEKFFFPCKPLVPKPKNRARVLIEGPICIPFKGMADSYAAVASLDCDIWIVSSAGLPPDDWKYDRFFEAVSFSEMRTIYSSCDIFLKMSRVEGFFGPPLEAMSCGCAVVVGKVTGYDEYIENAVNALVVEQGDINAAREAVSKLIGSVELRMKLIENGYKTSKQWSWDQSLRCMLAVLEN